VEGNVVDALVEGYGNWWRRWWRDLVEGFGGGIYLFGAGKLEALVEGFI